MPKQIDIDKVRDKIGFIDENGNVLPELAYALNNSANVLMTGDTGTGKTFVAEQLCEAVGWKYSTLNFYNTTNATKILGGYKPVEGKFLWLDGVLTECMREGKVFIGEEANFMRSDVSSVLYPIMDFRRTTVLDEHPSPSEMEKGIFKPEVVKAHPDFRIILTCNLNYRGTEKFNPAIKNRIGSYIRVEYLTTTLEAAFIVKKFGIDKEVAGKMCKVAASLRANREKTGYDPVSTRIVEEWARHISKGIPPLQAAQNTIVPCITDDPKEQGTLTDFILGQFSAKKRGDDDD